jgi:predicted flap endonuclease-1-like 5' DNA nuclease
VAYSIEEIEGIGPAYAAKLAVANIRTTAALLTACATRKGREETEAATGIDAGRLLKWANMADLMRISGVGEEYSELLEAAGVDTVKELRNRRADNLAAKMAEVNAKKKLVRQVPSQSQVEKWVAQAKTLDPAISY